MKRKLAILPVLLFLVFSNIYSQNFDEVMSQLSEDAARAYLKPISNAIGSNLNSGWMARVPEATKTFKFHIDIKLVGMGTFFSDDAKTFSASGQFYFSQNQVQQILYSNNITPNTVGTDRYNATSTQMLHTKYEVVFSGPSIIGKKDEHLKITFPGDPNIKDPNGTPIGKADVEIKEVYGYLEDMPVFPLAAPQITIGTVFGTNIAVRYLSYKNLQDIGDLSWFGIGGIHNPSVWFPNPLPVDIGIGFYQQRIKVGDIIENNSSLFGAYVGKTFGGAFAFIPYAGVTVEKSTTKIKYSANQTISGMPVIIPVDFELEGENSTGVMVGFTIKLGLVNINADYKVAKSKTASAGISLGW